VSLYVRIFTNFYSSRKTAHLQAVIGTDAFWVPPRIWAYAAINQPDGDLSRYPAQVLANLIGYTGDATRMHQALLEAGFLDPDLRIHDWQEHNGYHVSYAERAKTAAASRWAKKREKKVTDLIVPETSIALSNATSMDGGELELDVKVKPPESPSQELRRKAVEILMHLNSEASREFRVCDTHLKAIIARLTEVDGDMDGVKKMITRMCGCWKNDPEKAQYLDPDTLFRASKFPKYYDKRNLAVVTTAPALTKPPTTFDIRTALANKEKEAEAFKRKHFREHQGLSGGQYLPAGWDSEQSKAEHAKLKAEAQALKEKFNQMAA
jgi:uncharacterized phage protein (TIGR02220 family)